MSENFEEMQFTPANGQQRITVVKGIKPDTTPAPAIEKTIHNLSTRICSLSLRSKVIDMELGRLREDLEAISHFVSKESTVSQKDDVSECSNTLSDFENDSDDDSDSDSDAVSDLNDDDRKSCEAVHKIYHINLNFN